MPIFGSFGAPGAIRTRGVPLRRRTLYPAEVQAHGIKLVLRGECSNTPLGGGRSILLSYRCQYEVVEPRGGCTNTRLGGGRSILLSYRCPKNYAKNCIINKRCSQVKESP